MLSRCPTMFRALCRRAASAGWRNIATVTKDTKIGIVGCGNVGKAVANNLVRQGFSVTCAFDPLKESMEAMPSGVRSCANPREIAEQVDVVVSCIGMPAHVVLAAEGPDGILAGLTKDKIWVDHSTTDYEKTLIYAEEAKAKGAHVLEAPITGGIAALKEGNMVVYLGGEQTVADAVTPMLEASYVSVFFVGKMGSAMILKVVSNMLAAVNLLAMTEVLLLAKNSGIDLKRFWEGIRLSAGQSFVWDTGAPFVFDRTYDESFTLELFCKDMQLGFDMAKKYKVPMPLNQLSMSTYRSAQYQYGDNAPCYIPSKAMEDALGVSLEYDHFKGWTYKNEIVNGGVVVKHDGIKPGYKDEQ